MNQTPYGTRTLLERATALKAPVEFTYEGDEYGEVHPIRLTASQFAGAYESVTGPATHQFTISLITELALTSPEED